MMDTNCKEAFSKENVNYIEPDMDCRDTVAEGYYRIMDKDLNFLKTHSDIYIITTTSFEDATLFYVEKCEKGGYTIRVRSRFGYTLYYSKHNWVRFAGSGSCPSTSTANEYSFEFENFKILPNERSNIQLKLK